MTDPIADMLTRIRNAAQAQHEQTVIPSSKLKARLAEILKAEGYIDDYSVEDGVQNIKTFSQQNKYCFYGCRRRNLRYKRSKCVQEN